jgi:hypothetical protein
MRGLAVLAAAVFAAACDTGSRHDASLGVGPALNVVGFNGDATGGQLPADGTVQIAFDRLLHPASVTRQSFAIRDASGNFLQPAVTYDPVARVVTLLNPGGTEAWLVAGLTYTVSIGVSKADDYTGGSGPRAIDGATLAAAVSKTFQAVAPTAPTPTSDRAIDFCADVLPIFQLRCSGGSCHAAPGQVTRPAEGLVLQTAAGVANTALGRSSQESNTGALAKPQVQGRAFGVNMALVDPGNPGGSWLLYKVLLGQLRAVDQGLDAGVATCGAGGTAPLPVAQTTLPQPTPLITADERARLSEYVLGNQMPYPLNLPSSTPTPITPTDDESSTLPLTYEELQRVRAWITQGAKTAECPSCPQ